MTFNNILYEIDELPEEQQETLIDIVKKRLIEKRRNDIAEHAENSLNEYKKGSLEAESAADIISRLHKTAPED